MSNYKFRSDELYQESLPKIKEIDRRAERLTTQQSFDVPIESKPNTYKKVTTSKLRVRNTPNGEIVKILEKGVEVEILKEQSDNWAQLVDGTYVMSKYLR